VKKIEIGTEGSVRRRKIAVCEAGTFIKES
jgi:hypothetical protein